MDVDVDEEGIMPASSSCKTRLAPARMICTLLQEKKLDLVTQVGVRVVSIVHPDDGDGADVVHITNDDRNGYNNNCLMSGTPFSMQVVLSSQESNFLSDPQIEDVQWEVRYSEGGGGVKRVFEVPNMEAILGDAHMTAAGGHVSL
jgi:hypothetical protein